MSAPLLNWGDGVIRPEHHERRGAAPIAGWAGVFLAGRREAASSRSTGVAAAVLDGGDEAAPLG
ncbi:MAG: hypothetical protein ACRDS0_23030, partial [Pseudonocardiaceae bacterium]